MLGASLEHKLNLQVSASGQKAPPYCHPSRKRARITAVDTSVNLHTNFNLNKEFQCLRGFKLKRMIQAWSPLFFKVTNSLLENPEPSGSVR